MPRTQSRSLEIAKTILAQFGGDRFMLMTGAKMPIAIESGLFFRVGSNPKKVTHVRVTLTPADDYTVEFLRIRGFNSRKELSREVGVYCDQLQDVFFEHTGLYTRL
ncbi:MAG TPA: hypothetical protein VEF36_01320 [Roseiarcus sp.]|nr:hypothetical protein [Roseiarcus sp.]